MIPIQILRVLSTMRAYDVPALLMGGQACVLYGAAEYSRDLDLAVLATADAFSRLDAARKVLDATEIAVPPFEREYLERGHAIHIEVPFEGAMPLRVDIMSRMRGVDVFPALWQRRVTVMLDDAEGTDVPVDVLALQDLVSAKKTQRDKDWPMIRRLVDASYVAGRDEAMSDERVQFWLAELRSPEFLMELVSRRPDLAEVSLRPAVQLALHGGDVQAALSVEQAEEMAADRQYWLPLRRELESLRHAARLRGSG